MYMCVANTGIYILCIKTNLQSENEDSLSSHLDTELGKVGLLKDYDCVNGEM